MRSFCTLVILFCGFAVSHGCGGDTGATKPAVIPASPAAMPKSDGGATGSEKAGSTAKPSTPM